MDINPLIADLNKYKEELIDSIHIAIGLNELRKADRSIANVENIYNLLRQEVVEDIRKFTNRSYKTFLPGDPKFIKNLEFDKSEEI